MNNTYVAMGLPEPQPSLLRYASYFVRCDPPTGMRTMTIALYSITAKVAIEIAMCKGQLIRPPRGGFWCIDHSPAKVYNPPS